MTHSPSTAPAAPWIAQILAWLTGLTLCVAGMFDRIPNWVYGYAVCQLLVLLAAPICWNWHPRRRPLPPVETSFPGVTGQIATLVLLMGLSLTMSVWASRLMGNGPPPVYHDEFSYLFQAKTFLAGRTWFPSPPMHAELFDQMHVLNDGGRMASRYFPGTGLLLAPFAAVGHPHLGHWICGMLATAFVYAAGCELGNFRSGFLAGLLTALSPGLAIFSNLLLAHHPTLLGLSFFLWRISRWQRTHSGADALLAGIGLSWAMLCRPMTAAGFGLPFGIGVFLWLCAGSTELRRKAAVVAGFAVPIALGLVVQLGYNASITGSLWSSPYQLYTDVYTPRHVYGFNNVARGERNLGPKVLDDYDRWARNLDARLAAENVFQRGEASLMWTWDLLPLAMTAIVALRMFRSWDARRRMILYAILSLHLAHVPYWFTGIMHWHYVFESAILWTLAGGLVIDQLLTEWRTSSRPWMRYWLAALCLVAVAFNWVSVPELWTAKVVQEAPNFRVPRLRFQQFRQWTASEVGGEPALVLVAPHADLPHLDYVVNDPGLRANPVWAICPRQDGPATDCPRLSQPYGLALRTGQTSNDSHQSRTLNFFPQRPPHACDFACPQSTKSSPRDLAGRTSVHPFRCQRRIYFVSSGAGGVSAGGGGASVVPPAPALPVVVVG